MEEVARNKINTSSITAQWDQMCRLAASLEARTVTPSAMLRTFQRGPNASSLSRAVVELGRVIKTLHVLDYCHDPEYRRAIHYQLQRGERRNSLARNVFHGGLGQLRQHYQAGQENQLGSRRPLPHLPNLSPHHPHGPDGRGTRWRAPCWHRSFRSSAGVAGGSAVEPVPRGAGWASESL